MTTLHVQRAATWTTGLTIMCASIAAMIASGWGASSIDVAIVGLSNSTGLNLTIAVWVANAAMIAAAVACGAQLRAGIIAAAVVMGPLITGFLALYGTPGPAAGAVYATLGIAGIGAGSAVLVASSWSSAPTAVLFDALGNHVGGFGRAALLVGAVTITIGWALDGGVGPATAAGVFGIGVAAGWTHQLLTPWKNRMTGNTATNNKGHNGFEAAPGTTTATGTGPSQL